MTDTPEPNPIDALVDDTYVLWGPPPPTGKYGQHIAEFVDRLKQHPTVWGQLAPLNGEYFPASVVSSINAQYGEDIEAVSRSAESTDAKVRVRVYARWLTADAKATEMEARRQRRQTRIDGHP